MVVSSGSAAPCRHDTLPFTSHTHTHTHMHARLRSPGGVMHGWVGRIALEAVDVVRELHSPSLALLPLAAAAAAVHHCCHPMSPTTFATCRCCHIRMPLHPPPPTFRSAFPSIIKCYAQACSGIATGAALRAPPSTTTATAATKRTDNNHNNSKSSSSTSPSSAAVCIDEEIFSATIRVMAEGFLEMDLQRLQQEVDCQRVAADVAGLVAITNSFVSQPWKKWLYLGLPNLCQVRVDMRVCQLFLAAVVAILKLLTQAASPSAQFASMHAPCKSPTHFPAFLHAGRQARLRTCMAVLDNSPAPLLYPAGVAYLPQAAQPPDVSHRQAGPACGGWKVFTWPAGQLPGGLSGPAEGAKHGAAVQPPSE